jgi:cyclopropane-fatty-acyl-phospholipid synthase
MADTPTGPAASADAAANGTATTVRHRLELSAPGRLLPTRASRRVLLALLRRLRRGRLRVVEPKAATTYGDGDGPSAEVRVVDPRAWSLILQRGSVGLGEAFVDEMIDTDDLAAFLGLLTRNLRRLNRVRNRIAPLANALAWPFDRARGRSPSDDRRHVVAHYDVGDDFFELFLDSTMAYSCGVFEGESSTLEAASVAKFDRVCRKLALGPGDHVVEIGTGWGGFAVHAATRYGCRVTTTTISEHQFRAASRRVVDAGVGGRVTVLNRDYRELGGTYSHLVSIEMIEAVDWRDYDTYFAAIDRLLEPGGSALVQCIVIADADYERAKRRDEFLRHYIFPGGCLPSMAAISASLARATRLAVLDTEDLGAHYVRTLQQWRRRLEHRSADARARGYSERFLRLWRFYLSYCEAAFAEAHVTDVQLLLGDRRAAARQRVPTEDPAGSHR